ncbi:ABC transporter ATP-binding protein [Candidatus Dependentiae bacterium]|nr:ABC transporter ATP-binding protein [Candidatus Dependentiae bacterium]
MKECIQVEGVNKVYDLGDIQVQALKDISFSLPDSSFVSFVGPSGSGKTTLLNLIGCLDVPTSGRIDICGEDITKLSYKERARFRGNNLGIIFQDFNLISVLTVFENIEYPLIMVQNLPASERRERVMELLESVEMLEQKDKFPSQISGGQKQRVAVARALAVKPRFVLADEPTANLDHETAYKIISLMKKMRDERGTSFIFSTHDLKVVKEVDYIYKIEDGFLKGKEKVGGENV